MKDLHLGLNEIDFLGQVMWKGKDLPPELTFVVDSREIDKTWFNVEMYQILDEDNKFRSNSVLVCECEISIDDLFQRDSINHFKKFSKDMKKNGEEIGILEIIGEFKWDYIHIKRIPGTLVNGTYKAFAPIQYTNSKSNLDIFPPIDQLKRKYEELKQLYVIRSSNPRHETDKDTFNYETIRLFLGIRRILKNDEFNHEKMIKYPSNEHLLQGQIVLAKIFELISINYREIEEEQKKTYFELLKTMIKRNEWKLGSFESEEQKPWSTEKIAMGVSYQTSLYYLLKIAIEDLNTPKSKRETQIQFLILSISFFKVSPFRKLVITKLSGKTEEEIKLVSDKVEGSYGFGARLVTRWQDVFYDFIKSNPGYEKNEKMIEEELEQSSIFRYGFNDKILLSFISSTFEYVVKNIRIPSTHLKEMYGYQALRNVLVKKFFLHPSEVDLDTILRASKIMMFDEENFLIFDKALCSAIENSEKKNFFFLFRLEFLNQWCFHYSEVNQEIPKSFETDLIIAEMRNFVYTDHLKGMIQTTLFVYTHFHVFPLNIKKRFFDFYSDEVLDLAFHWFQGMRSLIAHLLIYRFCSEYEIAGQDEFPIQQMLNKILFADQLSKMYHAQLKEWNHLPKVQKRKFSIKKLKEKVLENRDAFFDIPPLESTIFNDFIANHTPSLHFRKRRSSSLAPSITESQLEFCTLFYEELLIVAKGYMTSDFRTCLDYRKLPLVKSNTTKDLAE